MTYFVNHTDTSIPPYTVYDHTTNTDTSLKFSGKYVADYGQSVAENFLHLLENFASASEPSSPQIGQLWYDTSVPERPMLRVHSGTGSTVAARWKAASGIEYNAENPGSTGIGQLWVDTANRQLNIFTGSSWMVVGPTISTRDGLKNGAVVEDIIDDGDTVRSVLVVYVSDIPVAIVSKDSFNPKAGIPNWYRTELPKIRSGINLNKPVSTADKAKFKNGLPELTGTASAARALVVGTAEIESAKFFRTDIINNTDHAINIKHNDGVAIGTDRNLIISYSANTNIARLYNSSAGSIELQTEISGSPKTILKVTGNKVGINNDSPSAALDVNGDAIIDGKLTITGGMEIRGHITKGAILDQVEKDAVQPTDWIALVGDNDLTLKKTTVAKLLAGVQPQVSTVSALPTRKTLQQTSASVGPGESIILTLPGGYKGYALYAITVSSTAWVRVYSSYTAAVAHSEAFREEGTDPDANTGVIADVVIEPTDFDVTDPATGAIIIDPDTDLPVKLATVTTNLTPAVIGYSSASTPNTDIVVRVKNKGAAATTITVKLTILQLEA